MKNVHRKLGKEHRMSPDMHTEWWNVKTRKSKEMILMTFRGFLLVMFILETLREWEPILIE